MPDEHRQGVAAPTNVAKLALAIVTGDESGQALFYEPGVGTNPDERLLGGAFGYGLSRNVQRCYRFLALNYQPGDELYLFGFSRGAYTARSLAGLIRNCGILRAEHVDQVDEAFAFYRDRTSQSHPSAVASQLFRGMYSHEDEDIHFIGVWDTVGALGIPSELPEWDWLSKRVTGWERLWGFHDTDLSSHVRYAYHAVAIDERRAPFRPTLWTQREPVAGQTLEQVWFAGVHTEVGGGSRDTSLSDIALLWMAQRATDCGLELKPGLLQVGSPDAVGAPVPNYAGPIVDSRRGVYAAFHAYDRLTHDDLSRAPAQALASSAHRRFAEAVDGYAPDGFANYFAQRPATQVVEVAPPG